MNTLENVTYKGQPLAEVLGTPAFVQFQAVRFSESGIGSNKTNVYYISGIKANFEVFSVHSTECIRHPYWSYYLVNQYGYEWESNYSENSVLVTDLVKANA